MSGGDAARNREMQGPLTQAEDRRIEEGHSKETVAKERFCRLRPDGIAVLPPVGNKAGVFCILEHKRMSDVCDRYLTRAKITEEDQYVSLRSAISKAIQREGWRVEQIRFITGAHLVNKQDLRKNLKFFNVPAASIESIYSKLAMRVFDVYANIFSNACITLDSAEVQRGWKLLQKPNRLQLLSPPLFVQCPLSIQISTKSERKSTRTRR
jgi:hypothetical protein